MPKKMTDREFYERGVLNGLIPLDPYMGNKGKALVRCSDCGHEWSMRCDHILLGDKGCPECARNNLRKTTEEVGRELKECGMTLLGVYNDRKTPIRVRCDTCGHVWSFARNNTNGSCAKCAKMNMDTKKPPEIVYEDEDSIGFIADGEMVYISKCDTELIDRSIRLDKNGYPIMMFNRNSKFLHRLIMNDPNTFVDHIDRNPLNNRRSNLRCVTRSQNAMNSKCRRDSGTGIRGVSYNKKYQHWTASICKDGVVHGLGTYHNVDFAVGARKQAERELFGEYAPK